MKISYNMVVDNILSVKLFMLCNNCNSKTMRDPGCNIFLKGSLT